MSTTSRGALARRSFFARLGGGMAAFGAAFGASEAAAQPPAAPGHPPFAATRHEIDDWFDQIPGARHRLYLDTTTVDGVAHAIFWSNNFLNASRNAYGLTDAESAVVIGVRHESTPFAFTDAMWAKYGAALAGHAASFTDPATKRVPAINLLQSAQMRSMVNRGVTIAAVAARGVRFAVCALATRAIATEAEQAGGPPADDVFKDLTANLVPNARLVPAGIVALSRAQERGFTFNYIA